MGNYINLEKKIFLIFLVFVLTLNVFADIPTEIEKLMGKDGVFISIINGKRISNEDGVSCRIVGGDGSSAVLIDSASSLKPMAHLDGAKKEFSNKKIVYTTEDINQDSNDLLCAANIPLVSYQKIVEVEGSTLLIKQKYRCLLEKSVEVIQGCSINL